MKIKAVHIPGVLFILFGLLIIWESRRLQYGSESGPGPGFFPFWLGSVIVLTAFLSLYKSGKPEREKVDKDPFFSGWQQARKPVLVLAAFSALIILVRFTGFYIGSALFIGLIVGIVERRSWTTVAAVTILSLVGFYYVFDRLLQVQLPVIFFKR